MPSYYTLSPYIALYCRLEKYGSPWVHSRAVCDLCQFKPVNHWLGCIFGIHTLTIVITYAPTSFDALAPIITNLYMTMRYIYIYIYHQYIPNLDLIHVFGPVWYMVLAGWYTVWYTAENLKVGLQRNWLIFFDKKCLNYVNYWWYISYHTLFGISDRISALGPIYHPSLRSGWYTWPAGWYTVWYTK